MKSRSKTDVDLATVNAICLKAGIGKAEKVEPLGAGEFNTVLAVKAGGKEYALKIAPSDSDKVLTYEKDMMRAETYWYDVMRRRTDIPVPEVYFSDFSHELLPADWFVMQKLDGVHPSDKMTEEESAALTEKLAQMAAEIHKVRGEFFGYTQGEHFPDWYAAIRALVETLLADGRRKGMHSRRGKKLLRYIDRYADVLKKADCRMVNYDIWVPNIIVSDTPLGKKYWWIDPERMFWGDRMADFVCLEFFKPFREKTASVKAYNSVAEDPVPVDREYEIRWAVMMAYMGLLQEVEKYYRYTPFMFGWWRNVISSAFAYSKGFKALKETK